MWHLEVSGIKFLLQNFTIIITSCALIGRADGIQVLTEDRQMEKYTTGRITEKLNISTNK